ncbi:MAG: undecaprenyl-phosphate galactose phosphotransferase WbaP [candidate division WOR-3 bacterium]
MRRLKKLISILLLIITDAFVFALAYLLAYFLRDRLLPLLIPRFGPLLPFEVLVARYYLLFVYIIAFAYERLYTQRFTIWEETKRLWRGSFIATGLTIIAIYITRAYSVSRTVVVLAFVLSLVLLPLARILLKWLLLRVKLWSKKVVVVGDDATSQAIRKEILKNKNLGYEIINQTDIPIDNDDWLTKLHPDSVIVSAQTLAKDTIAKFFQKIEGKCEEFIIVPELAQMPSVGVEIIPLDSLLLMKFRYNLLQPTNLLLKRTIEFCLAIVALLIFSPFFLFSAIAIKLTSPGPVLFKQPRIGKDKKLFNCLKFRSMYQDAEARLDALLKSQVVSREEWNKFFKLKGKDPRVTPFGRFLRRFSLDELPQLFNILRGEMNLVGPRPYLPRELDNIGNFINIITKVLPGMTGLWQVSGRSELSFKERLLLDEYYVKNWSLWMDFVIILKTFGVVLKGKGAY